MPSKLPHQCHFFQIHRKHPRDLALMVGSQIQFHLILHNNKDMTRLLLSGLGMLTFVFRDGILTCFDAED